jgi:hypothetical protein
MRAYRRRRKRRLRYIRTLVDPSDLDGLVRLKLLRNEERNDLECIAGAIRMAMWWAISKR